MWHFLRIWWELIDFVYNNRESPVRGVIFPRQAQPRTQGHLQEEEKEEIQPGTSDVNQEILVRSALI